jgi:hypothetical protein
MYLPSKADINRYNKDRRREGRVTSIYARGFFLSMQLAEKARISTDGPSGRRKMWLRFFPLSRANRKIIRRFHNHATWMRGIG